MTGARAKKSSRNGNAIAPKTPGPITLNGDPATLKNSKATHTGHGNNQTCFGDGQQAAPVLCLAPFLASLNAVGLPPGLPPPAAYKKELPMPSPKEHSRHLADGDTSAGLTQAEVYTERLRERPLPITLFADKGRLDRLQTAILSCVESFYIDRIMPTLGEIEDRLCSSGWPRSEGRAVLPLCARNIVKFKLVPPQEGQAPLVLLRTTPPGFQGFVDIDAPDMYSSEVRKDVRAVLLSPGVMPLKGSVASAASILRKYPLPTRLQSLSLGELRHVLSLSLGPWKLLAYGKSNGGFLELAKAPDCNTEATELKPSMHPGPVQVPLAPVGFSSSPHVEGTTQQILQKGAALPAADREIEEAGQRQRQQQQQITSMGERHFSQI